MLRVRNLTFILILIGVFLWGDVAYSAVLSLRVPMGKIEEGKYGEVLLEVFRDKIQKEFEQETNIAGKVEYIEGHTDPRVPLYRVSSISELKGLIKPTGRGMGRLLYYTKSAVIKKAHLEFVIEDERAFYYEGMVYSKIFRHFKEGFLAAPIALLYDEASKRLYYIEERLDYSFLDKMEECKEFDVALELVRNLGRFLGQLTKKGLIIHLADMDPEHFRLRGKEVILTDMQGFESQGIYSNIDIGERLLEKVKGQAYEDLVTALGKAYEGMLKADKEPVSLPQKHHRVINAGI